ncbi:MAG: site-specific integrase [Azonexus sp.]
MSLAKRGDIWWIDIRHQGRRIRRSTQTGNKKQAQELHDRLKSELWREENLDDLPSHTWEEAVKRFLCEESGRPGLWHDAQMIEWLTPKLSGKDLAHIDSDLIADLLAERAQVVVNKKTGRKTSPSTVNRHSATLGKLLRKAKRWGWLKDAPEIAKRREPNGRVRFLSGEEHIALLAELPEPLKACARFTLATGLREDNCTHLEWARVSLPMRQAWVHADDVKTNKSLLIPLNDDAMAILDEQKGKHPLWVFPTAHDGPMPAASCTTWYLALKRAKVENFRWHDLRHTWASWHVMAGTPLEVLQKLGGWAKLEMVMRYAHLAPSFIAGYANNVKPPEVATVTNWSQQKAKV